MSLRPRWNWRFLTSVGALTVLAAASYAWSAYFLMPPRARNLLHVPREALDLGEQFATKGFKWQVPLKNHSHSPVTVQDIRVGCECTSVEPRAFTLAPGEATLLSFTLDLTNGMQPGDPPRKIGLSFLPILANGFAIPDGWMLRGLVKPVASPSQRHLEYDGATRLIAGSEFAATRFSIDIYLDDVELEARCDKDIGSVEVGPLGERKSFHDIRFTPNAALGVGTHKGAVVFECRRKGQLISEMEIPVTLRIVGVAEASPPFLDLGIVDAESRVESIVTIASTSGNAIQIIDNLAQDHALEIIPDSTQGTAYSVKIAVPDTKPGRQEFVARVGVVAAGNTDIEVLEVPIAYSGVRNRNVK